MKGYCIHQMPQGGYLITKIAKEFGEPREPVAAFAILDDALAFIKHSLEEEASQ